MQFGNVKITLGANEVIIGAVIAITVALMVVEVPESSKDLFKQGLGTLIAWGALYTMAKKPEDKP